jgi:hypothetical protein
MGGTRVSEGGDMTGKSPRGGRMMIIGARIIIGKRSIFL